MIIYVSSGLMSRCISLVQMYNLLKEYKYKKLTIIWPIDSDCGIGFWDVFARELFSDIKLEVIEWRQNQKLQAKYKAIGGIKKNLTEKNVIGLCRCIPIRTMLSVEAVSCTKWRIPQYWSKMRGCYIDYYPRTKDEQWDVAVDVASTKLHQMLKKHKSVFLRAYRSVNTEKNHIDDYSCIRFKQEYMDVVQRIIQQGEKVVGVHIRRTDHKVSISNSSTDSFVIKMREICNKEPKTKFFLATDDKKELQNLTEIFGDCIITQPMKKWGRSSEEEMVSGIIDMLCLSKCDYILGSYTSAFSEFASLYGGKSLLICKD